MKEQELIENIRKEHQPSDPYGRQNRAGVLVPLFIKDNEIYVFLTVRSKNMNSYPGQVAFPGGRQDTDDKSIVMTALREAKEEVGLDPNDVHVIAALEPVLSRTKLLVTPIIGIISHEFKPSINPHEVDICFHAPLRIFLEGGEKYHKFEDIQWNADVFRLHHFIYEGHDIWGMTASILIKVASLAYAQPPKFDPVAKGQPDHSKQIKEIALKGAFGEFEDTTKWQ